MDDAIVTQFKVPWEWIYDYNHDGFLDIITGDVEKIICLKVWVMVIL